MKIIERPRSTTRNDKGRDYYSSTTFDKQKKGAFVISVYHIKIRFKDLAHRDAALFAAKNRTFATNLEYVRFLRACPNGYTNFISFDNQPRNY